MKNDNTKIVIDDIQKGDIDYVIVDQMLPETYQYLIPAVNGRRDLFLAAYKSPPPETYILKLRE